VPLNIQISENSQDTNTLLASEGLLAIASSSSSVNEGKEKTRFPSTVRLKEQ
jgi:hypothetical protein